MALVTVEELALVLGTGDLYTAELEEVIDATDNVILPLLKLHRASVIAVNLKSNIARIEREYSDWEDKVNELEQAIQQAMKDANLTKEEVYKKIEETGLDILNI
jgi:Skp family chaperone for outer membrane proteins